MASLSELKGALLDTLEARGVLGELKARVHEEIFRALDEPAPRPAIPTENLLINELIREYLEYNGHQHTLSVFLAESGHPETRTFDRKFIADELRIADCGSNSKPDRERRNNAKLPLLYSLTAKKEPEFTAEGLLLGSGGTTTGGGESRGIWTRTKGSKFSGAGSGLGSSVGTRLGGGYAVTK